MKYFHSLHHQIDIKSHQYFPMEKNVDFQAIHRFHPCEKDKLQVCPYFPPTRSNVLRQQLNLHIRNVNK